MKKVLSILICMLVGISNVVAIAGEQDAYDTYENFIIEETEDTVLIKECIDKKVTEIHVPGEINGKRVELDGNAFLGAWWLESVSFGEGIVVLPQSLCDRCEDLKHVDIPESLVEIREYAFAETGLEEIDIKNVEVIGAFGFKDCSNLIQVVHSGNLKKLGSDAFRNCDDLSSIDLSSVKEMGSSVFENCDSLEYVNIENLSDWWGVSADDVNQETMVFKEFGVYNRDPLRRIRPVGCISPFSDTPGLKIVRMNLKTIHADDLEEVLFLDCENIETVIFERFVKPSMWEFYITEGVEKVTFINRPEKMTIYGRGEDVKAYAESIGVPFKELIDVHLNDERIWMDDCLPYIKNDRTMVPMRAIFEALSATVTWDDTTKTAIGVKDGVEVKITIGENVLYKNGEAIELDCAAEITNDRTMVPVRAISEAFGCIVTWNDETKTVEITN